MKVGEKNTPIINVVFDIDETIATGFPDTKEDEIPEWAKIFKVNDLYIDAIAPHIIHPGVKELIQFLDKMNVKISFYSSGPKERNEIFVEKLLCKALGEKRYQELKKSNQVKIISELVSSDKAKGQEQARLYGDNFHRDQGVKKDLQKAVEKIDNIDWSVLIEDTLAYGYYGQEKNLLKVPLVQPRNFESLHYYFNAKEEPLKSDLEDIFRRTNNIFYAAGVFFSALEKALTENISLKDALFQIQFIKNGNQNESEMIYNHKVSQNINYYDFGLQKLKAINPDLNFLTPSQFLNLTNEEKKPLVEKTIQNWLYPKYKKSEFSESIEFNLIKSHQK